MVCPVTSVPTLLSTGHHFSQISARQRFMPGLTLGLDILILWFNGEAIHLLGKQYWITHRNIKGSEIN